MKGAESLGRMPPVVAVAAEENGASRPMTSAKQPSLIGPKPRSAYMMARGRLEDDRGDTPGWSAYNPKDPLGIPAHD